MTNFSIKDLSDFSGIKPHTIRIWEQRFTFLKPSRNETLRRLYNPKELNVLLDVSLLNQGGYKVSRIARMTSEEKALLVARMDLSQQQQRHIHELIISMAEMDTERFEMILDSCIHYYGIHISIEKVIMPFCERVGLLQKLDSSNYIENILLIKETVKHKLHFGIEKASSVNKDQKCILLFLPLGEQQELMLLYLNYLLKMEGLQVLYLGKHVSVENMERISRIKKPDIIITQLLEKNIRIDLSRFVAKMPDILPASQLVTLGNSMPVTEVRHYKHLGDASAVMAFLKQ